MIDDILPHELLYEVKKRKKITSLGIFKSETKGLVCLQLCLYQVEGHNLRE